MECVETSPGPDPVDASSRVPSRRGRPDDEDAGPGAPHPAGNQAPPDEGTDPLRFSHWMKRTATGAVLTGIARGLHQALEPPRKESSMVTQARGEPEDPDGPIELRFDPDSPAGTVAVIRRPADGGDPEAPTSQP